MPLSPPPIEIFGQRTLRSLTSFHGNHTLFALLLHFFLPSLSRKYCESDSATELISGGLSGMLAWASIGPIDGIKTRVQAGPKTGTASLSMISVARDIQAEGGTRQLFRGAGPMVARAFVANAVIFSVYEECWRQIGRA